MGGKVGLDSLPRHLTWGLGCELTPWPSLSSPSRAGEFSFRAWGTRGGRHHSGCHPGCSPEPPTLLSQGPGEEGSPRHKRVPAETTTCVAGMGRGARTPSACTLDSCPQTWPNPGVSSPCPLPTHSCRQVGARRGPRRSWGRGGGGSSRKTRTVWAAAREPQIP